MFCLLVVCFFSSCFKDDGNYDYKDLDIHEITIRFPTYSYTAYAGEPVVFRPQVTYLNEGQKESGDTNMYKWSYYFDDLGCVCTDRNMDVVLENVELNKSYDGIVIAEDTLTGAYYTQNISFSYTSQYKVGWVILSDNGGKSVLNLIREQNGEWYTDKDIYQTLYQKDLGTKPVGLIGNRVGRKEIRVLQDGPEGDLVLLGDGTCELIGTFADEFVDGKYPEGFRPKEFDVGTAVAVMTGENGALYTKVFEEYAYEYFVNVPLSLDNNRLNVKYLLQASPGGKTHDPVFFDETNNSFFVMHGASFYDAGRIYKLLAPAAWNGTDGPSPDNLSAYEVLFCQLRNASDYDQNVIAVLKRLEDGNLYIYSFDYNSFWYNQTVSNISFKQIPVDGASLLETAVKIHALRSRAYMFFVPQNDRSQLFYYDLRTDQYVLFKTFSSEITAIESDFTNDNQIGVGLDNGEIFILDVSEETLISGTENDKVIYSTAVDGGVVDMYYKNS